MAGYEYYQSISIDVQAILLPQYGVYTGIKF